MSLICFEILLLGVGSGWRGLYACGEKWWLQLIPATLEQKEEKKFNVVCLTDRMQPSPVYGSSTSEAAIPSYLVTFVSVRLSVGLYLIVKKPRSSSRPFDKALSR